MVDTFRKAVLASVGIAFLTGEKVQEMGKKMAEESQSSQDEARKFVEELQARSNETRRAVEKMINERVEQILSTMNLPSRDKMEQLQKQVDSIETRVALLEKQISQE